MNNIKILWADDEIEHLKAHLLFLEEKGYEVTTVTNGLDATDKVKENNYDLVFLDENMPGVSGLEALKIIKETDSNIPVVMITKSEEDHIMEDAIGSKIADYLIKPVNPRQILSTIKKLIDNTRLETESVTQRYQQDFRHIGMTFMDYMNWPKWKETYKKLVYWETEMASSEETGMEEILKTQKQDGNREFSKYINRNYIDFLSASVDNEDAPMMSHNLMKRGILPHKKMGEPFFLLLLDNLRFDQWKVIQKEVSKYYRTTSEDMYMSILPTTTQYARNAIFSGMMPMDIERKYGDKWSSDEDDGGKNLHESFFLNDLFKRLKTGFESKYIKVTNLNNAKQMVEQLPNLVNEEFVTIVYNFIDTLSHARTDSKIVRELAEDEAAYRALTLSWFEHSPLLETIRFLSAKGVKIVITTDHGSVRVDKTVKMQGDKDTTTNLRYKTGRRISYDAKDVFEVKNPHDAMLPKLHMSSSYIFSRENDFFVYPNNLNHYAKYYKDTFQHGGVSMEEMMIPLIALEPK
ncbi:MAG: bifunctional response regulator/alkaline phosphatase family protein [Bacteroidia bacterium]|jgi:CheY-like chemotaxis protein|nr:bifunctional response regulator/alkaline phosphatase family protein [Bacteroidia bacterium]